jgi:hypothetical protein
MCKADVCETRAKICAARYNALFTGKSKFGRREGGQPITAAAVILDDAHAAFSVVREAFTLEVSSDEDPRRTVSQNI